VFVFSLDILSEWSYFYLFDTLCSLQDIIQKVKQSSNYASLLEHDQLLKLQRNKEALVGFSKSDYIALKNLKHPHMHITPCGPWSCRTRPGPFPCWACKRRPNLSLAFNFFLCFVVFVLCYITAHDRTCAVSWTYTSFGDSSFSVQCSAIVFLTRH